ncbi:MAG: hypothetical protein ACJAVM_000852 [Sulfitobacter sp.]|jgi:hypothetical protein
MIVESSQHKDPASLENTTRQMVFSAYHASNFLVCRGANLGDALSAADELVLDDVYRLIPSACPKNMSLTHYSRTIFEISETSRVGPVGARFVAESALTFMSQSGELIETLLLRQLGTTETRPNLYLVVLAEMTCENEYFLVANERAAAQLKIDQTHCISFVRGTRICLAGGQQRPIEHLHPDDMVLTRDDGAQPLRWIGQYTARATGDFAPVMITAGALNNARDLLVGRDHRLLIYQRHDALNLGSAEVVIKAADLVDGDTIRPQSGGFIDYFQLRFDSDQIIYAEGIATETMLHTGSARVALPPVAFPNPAALLRQASFG